jgi:hypothetical protein
VDPEDRVDRCAGRLLRKDVVMLVCAHCVECEEGHKEQAVSVPAHYDNELRRMYRELERTAAGALGRMTSARQCPAQSVVGATEVAVFCTCSHSFTSYGPSAVMCHNVEGR